MMAIADRFSKLPDLTAPALPYGAGRSYGDVCLIPNGTLLSTRSLDRFIDFDTETGVLHCESGLLLRDIIDVVVPAGWFLAVTPGTQFVTVGGAIGNDVHGKNHAQAGSFGDHVVEIELVRTTGERVVCSPNLNPGMFRATVGGLGLTGIIVRATLQLRRIPGSAMNVYQRRFRTLKDFFRLSEDHATSEYAVAWIDCLASGKALGRGVFSHADHSGVDSEVHGRHRSYGVPLTPPASPFNPITLRAFNSLFFYRAKKNGFKNLHYEKFFYPLDAIRRWNLLYGPKGFLQYQCVVPPDSAYAAIREVLERISQARQGSFLAVLKNFGCRRGVGFLSFPRPGTTLALDFPMRGDSTLRLLESLDEVVKEAGGALYPAKDARMSPEMFRNSFPDISSFESYRDLGLSSGLWQRVVK